MSEQEHTLLIVDDNESNRDLLARRLEHKGFVVATASDGRQALDILEIAYAHASGRTNML